MIRAILAVTFWGLYVPLAALIGFPVTFLTGDIRLLWQLAMWGARGGIWAGGVRVRAVGREHMEPRRPYIFMSNHVSNLDPPIIAPLLERRTSVLVKKELYRLPVLSTAMRIARLVPVDRRNRDAAIESVRAAAEVLRSGLSMLVFPEGTRSRDGRLLPFKKGPFHMAMESGVFIVPITMVGTHEAWPKGTFAIHPGLVTAVFHAPIDPAQYSSREELIQTVRKQIASALPEQYR
ncbi:MAG TPA: lysophospholipid acyltransferase family protein [Clostridia bacterium]|nr:lysophospholipid acyltransferase family protein [Clostridia bacterium]